MSLAPPAYISSLQNNIRARPISWEGAVRAKTITDADLKKIKSIDKVRKEQRKQTIESDISSFVTLFLGSNDTQGIFQAAAKREDIIQYLLVLIGDLMDDIPSFTTALIQHSDPYKPFFSFMTQSSNHEDPKALLTSAVVASIIAFALTSSTKTSPQTEEAIPKLNTYLSGLASSSDSGLQDVAVQEYAAILRSHKSRQLFWEQRKQTVNPLMEILQSAAGNFKDSDSTLFNGNASVRTTATEIRLGGGVGLQLLYHVLLVFWQLSFDGSMIGEGLDEDYDIVPLYTQLLRISPKEKTTRVLVSTLYNLMSSNKSTFLPAAVSAKLPALLTNVKGRHLTDPDLLEDISQLTTLLDDFSKSQTTFDEYAQEVRSGHLRWSPPHRNPTFWHENARKIFEDDKGALPKKLAEILAKGWEGDKQVLAIGCNDVACLIKEVPEKKASLEKMGIKGRLVELMQSDDETVRWESLRAMGEFLRYSFSS